MKLGLSHLRSRFLFLQEVAIAGASVSIPLFAQEEAPKAPGTAPELIPPPAPIYLPDSTLDILDAKANAYHNIPWVRKTFGVSGKGLTVAVVDTGINPYHEDYNDKIAHAESFVGADPTKAEDKIGHGSHVASIIAAKQKGIRTGAAPDARIVALKVFSAEAPHSIAPVNKALQWLVEHHEEHGISVVNLSLGDNSTNLRIDNGHMPALWKEIKRHIRILRDNNIAVVVSAGNFYNLHGHEEGMTFPAICRHTISVGAMYGIDNKGNGRDPVKGPFADGSITYNIVRGRCTPFTQRLSEELGGMCRTDIFAAGFEVSGASKPIYINGELDIEASTFGTSWASGTSQSAPVVSGLILLMQEHYRKVNQTDNLPSVDLIEKALRDGGMPLHDVEDDIAQSMDNVKSSGATFRSLQAERSFEALIKPGTTVTTPPHRLTLNEQKKLVSAQMLKAALVSRVTRGVPPFPDFKPNVRFYVSEQSQMAFAEQVSAAARERFTPLAIRQRNSPPEQTKIQVRYFRYPEDSAVAVAMANLIKEQLKDTEVHVDLGPTDVESQYPIGLDNQPAKPGDIEVWFPRQNKSN